MTISLYEVSVASFQQVLGAVSAFMDKGKKHCEENNVDLAGLVEARLYPDMMPLRFQIISVVHHSLGAVQGVEGGSFSPPSNTELDYSGLQQVVADACSRLDDLDRAQVEAFEGKEVTFHAGDFKLEFAAQDFLMTFSLPNLHFHATTAYDILRMQGVPLGKHDYLGRMRVAQ